MNKRTKSAVAIAAVAVAAPLLAAGPAAADSWHYYEGQRTGIGKIPYDRLYVRERGRKVTAYWFRRYTDAPPVCLTGKLTKKYSETYKGRYRFREFYTNEWVNRPTTFEYNRFTAKRRVVAKFYTQAIPGGGGWFRGQIFTGLPNHSGWCFK